MSSAAKISGNKSGNLFALSAPIVAAPGAREAALDFLRDLAREVSQGTVDLPCFPDVVIRVRNALADPDTKLDRTVTLVGAEPRLAARLLQTANSAAFNPSGRPLTDLRMAITRLGQQLVQSAAMAFAVQLMRDEASLRTIAEPLSELWKDSISVASICQVVARRTKVSPDEAFLTGLLHGIGSLYIMVRAVDKPHLFDHENNAACMDMVGGWHAPIGKAVLENWGFAEEMCEAIGAQADYDRAFRHETDLSDVLIASIVLAQALKQPEPRTIALEGITAFHSIGLTAQDCPLILRHAEYQLGSLQDALGC